MSALTDLFTSLANKIRSKLGTTTTYTPAQAIEAIDNVYNKGVTDTKKGNAAVGDVKSGKTFTSTNGVNLTGTFAQQTLTAITPSTSSQTKTADSGKYFTSVTVNAISPQRSTGTAASAAGRDSTGPYVYFPYGWWPNYSSSRNYTRLTEAQAISTVATEEQAGAITPNSTTALVITPSSGKLLSKVSVNVTAHTTTYTASSRSSSLDMGANHSHRYVSTSSVPNSNSGTYTPTGDSSAHDMGATNTYRYVNTNTVFNLGKKQGVGLFLQNLERYAFWFTTNNSCGGDVSISGTTCTFNNCSFCIFVIVNRADGRFLNLLVKYQNHWRWVDDDAGSTNKCGVDYVNCQDTYISIRRGTEIDLFINAWRYNF